MFRYAITDGRAGLRRHEEARNLLVARCAVLASDGVELLLVREKDLAAGELTALSRRVIAAVRETGAATRVLIAQRTDVALATGADGIHLSSAPRELTPEQVRQVFPGAFVSVSCHEIEDVQRAGREGASAVLFAPVFGKVVGDREVSTGTGLQVLREACEAAGEIPVFALGGVTAANSAECVHAGAAGVAGIRMFFGPL